MYKKSNNEAEILQLAATFTRILFNDKNSPDKPDQNHTNIYCTKVNTKGCGGHGIINKYLIKSGNYRR